MTLHPWTIQAGATVHVNLAPRGHDQVFVPRVPKWFVCNDAPPLSLVREALIDIAQSCGGRPIVHGHHVARGCVGACYCGVVPVFIIFAPLYFFQSLEI